MIKLSIIIFVPVICVSCHSNTKEKFTEYYFNTKELNSILRKSSKNAKALYFFDVKCGQCTSYLQKYYPKMRKKYGDSLDYYFITVDEEVDDFLQHYLMSVGISSGCIIHLKPNTCQYLIYNGLDYNIIFQNMKNNNTSVDFTGYPTSVIVSKNGYVKLQKITYLHQNSIHVRPYPWHDMLNHYISSIKFNTIDDSIYNLTFERLKQIKD